MCAVSYRQYSSLLACGDECIKTMAVHCLTMLVINAQTKWVISPSCAAWCNGHVPIHAKIILCMTLCVLRDAWSTDEYAGDFDHLTWNAVTCLLLMHACIRNPKGVNQRYGKKSAYLQNHQGMARCHNTPPVSCHLGMGYHTPAPKALLRYHHHLQTDAAESMAHA